jgi:hypothetical protein
MMLHRSDASRRISGLPENSPGARKKSEEWPEFPVRRASGASGDSFRGHGEFQPSRFAVRPVANRAAFLQRATSMSTQRASAGGRGLAPNLGRVLAAPLVADNRTNPVLRDCGMR